MKYTRFSLFSQVVKTLLNGGLAAGAALVAPDYGHPGIPKAAGFAPDHNKRDRRQNEYGDSCFHMTLTRE